MSNFKEDLRNVKAFVFDVDGVFSNGNIYLDPEGKYIRSMNIKDGYAVQFAVKQGFPVAVITGGSSISVKIRFNDLGVTDIYLQSSNKFEDFNDFILKYGLDPQYVLYMGDDLPDLEVMMNTGIPTCPADSVEEIKSVSKYISGIKGGEGCVRDVIEQVLRAQGKWMDKEALKTPAK